VPITYEEAISVADSNWRFPDLGRDMAIMGGGIVVCAALIGAGIGVVADVLWHRHRTG
jgi:hypothetical protein